MCCFYKIRNNGIPSYLAELIHFHIHKTYSCRTDAFKSSFFPLVINEWNKLTFNIGTSSFNIFRANWVKIIQPIPNSVFGIFNPLGLIKLIIRLQFGLSHLNEHRFNHNFMTIWILYAHAAWALSQQFTIFFITTTIIVLEYPF